MRLPPGYKLQPQEDVLNSSHYQFFDIWKITYEDGYVDYSATTYGISQAIDNSLRMTAAYNPRLPEDSIKMYDMHGPVIKAKLKRRGLQ